MYGQSIVIWQSGGVYIDIANGNIRFIDISPPPDKSIITRITTPWGESEDIYFYEGDCQLFTQTLYNPFRTHIYIVKVPMIDPVGGRAEFRVLSFAYNGNVMRSPEGYNLLDITHNLPDSAVSGSSLEYSYAISNNSLSNITVRLLFATNIDSYPRLYTQSESECTIPIPPIVSTNKRCWYDNWITGEMDCTDRTIGPGAYINLNGSIVISSQPGATENLTLGILVYYPDYWGPGKGEYVAPAGYQQGLLKSIAIEPPEVATIEISPSTASLRVGDTRQFVAIARDQIGRLISVPITWAVSNPSVGYVTPSTGSTVTFTATNEGTTNIIASSGAVSGLASVTVVVPTIYELKFKLSPKTTTPYVINTLNRFTNLLNNWLLTKVTNIKINSVVYNTTNHEIVVDIEEIPPSPISPLSSYSIEPLILPLLAVQAIIWLAPYIALLVGFIVAYIYFGKRPTVPTYSSLQIKTGVMSNEALVNPVEDVTVEIAGQTLIANTANNYTVTVSNLEIDKTYPIKAYIPLSPGSNVYKALYEYIIKIQDLPMNLLTAALKIDTFTQRDYRPCNLILDNGNPPPVGTIVRIFRPKTMSNGEVVLDPLGTTTIGADRCTVDTIKVPAYLTDKLIKTQFISNSIDPSQPSPTLIPGDQREVPTVEGEKNIIGVTVQTTLKNNVIPDKIEIIDKNTGVVVKSVYPKEYTTIITGIPVGTYTISVTKSGYKFSLCNLTPCEITFTTSYLGSISVTIVLESLIATCALNIYVEDKYRKPPKTETYISIEGKPEQLAPNGNLQIPEIIKGKRNFSVRAEGYECSDCGDRDILCITSPEIVTFKLDQTEEIPVPESITLSVNDQRGSVKVDKGATITIKATGQDTTEDVKIYNISELPDLLIATIPMGQTETTLTVPDIDTTFELQAFQRCIAGICGKSSNIISLTVGAGEEKCIVPGPFGVCLVSESLGRRILLIGGFIIGGLIAYKFVISPALERKK